MAYDYNLVRSAYRPLDSVHEAPLEKFLVEYDAGFSVTGLGPSSEYPRPRLLLALHRHMTFRLRARFLSCHLTKYFGPVVTVAREPVVAAYSPHEKLVSNFNICFGT